MEPPPLLETLLNPDGTETVQPLKAIKDKLGVGNGPLAEVKRFIPPIGQGSHSLGGHCHAIFTCGCTAGSLPFLFGQNPGYVKVTAEPPIDR